MRIKDFSQLYEGWETNEREFEFVGLSYILNDSIDMKAQNSFIFPPLKASHSNCQRKNKKSDEGMKNRFTHKFEGHQHSFILCKKSEKSWWIRLSFWYLICNILIKAIKLNRNIMRIKTKQFQFYLSIDVVQSLCFNTTICQILLPIL